MTQEELLSVAEIIERLVKRFEEQGAEHARKMAEHRASFGARTEADAKIIDGMRAEVEDLRSRLNALGIQAAKQAGEALGVELSPLEYGQVLDCLTQVQDMRAEIERLQWENKTMQKDAEDGYAEAIKVLGDPIALSKERDALRAEVADLRGIFDMVHASLGIKRGDHIGKAIEALKSQSTPTTKQHPVKVGEWVKAPLGTRGKVVSLGVDYLEVELTNGPPTRWWPVYMCEPCDPPIADHDTPAGKEAAEAASKVPK